MWPAKVFGRGIFSVQFGFLINISLHCLDLLSVVFYFRKNKGSLSCDRFDIENAISSESISMLKIIIMVTVWPGMTKRWLDFQFPFSKYCQICFCFWMRFSPVVLWNISNHPTCHLVAPGCVLSKCLRSDINIRDPSLSLSFAVLFMFAVDAKSQVWCCPC